MNEDDILMQAIRAMDNGDREQARALIAQVLTANPYYDTAWVWMAEAVDDRARKEECLRRALAINPVHHRARHALRMLQRQGAKPLGPLETLPTGQPTAHAMARASDTNVNESVVQSVQCPKCGAPLHTELSKDRLYCSYCGAALRLTKGPSGHYMATLQEISANTSTIVVESRLNRLVNQLHTRETEVMRLETARDKQEALLVPEHPSRASLVRGTRYFLSAGFGTLLLASGLLCVSLSVTTPHDPASAWTVSKIFLIGAGIVLLIGCILLAFGLIGFRRVAHEKAHIWRKIAEIDSQLSVARAEIESLHKDIGQRGVEQTGSRG